MMIRLSAGDDNVVVLSTTKTKKQNAPAKLQQKILMRKEFCKMARLSSMRFCRSVWCVCGTVVRPFPARIITDDSVVGNHVACNVAGEEVLLLAPKATSTPPFNKSSTSAPKEPGKREAVA